MTAAIANVPTARRPIRSYPLRFFVSCIESPPVSEVSFDGEPSIASPGITTFRNGIFPAETDDIAAHP
jgi:hypothetical protein